MSKVWVPRIPFSPAQISHSGLSDQSLAQHPSRRGDCARDGSSACVDVHPGSLSLSGSAGQSVATRRVPSSTAEHTRGLAAYLSERRRAAPGKRVATRRTSSARPSEGCGLVTRLKAAPAGMFAALLLPSARAADGLIATIGRLQGRRDGSDGTRRWSATTTRHPRVQRGCLAVQGAVRTWAQSHGRVHHS